MSISHENLRKDLANYYQLDRYYNDKNYRNGYINRSKIRRNLQKWVCIYHYSKGSMKCNCCGEDIYEFLSVDHINNDGAEHRRNIKQVLYEWIIKHNFPEGLQILCFNCNLGKRINGGFCPHKSLNT